ncbi:Tat pathway signal protein [Sphingomonas sp. SUN019]|uniref:glucoamylase family protein n=1 Tax=Sphingomonas sp. SUN019 TaxID=2937788 RepID=UPI00216459D0|nr:glucoamylase family protein [Sphingomonas sp. SUN019]UVO50852.1 Tat pathway signal protein [Sphingomonas sp. SUN019]
MIDRRTLIASSALAVAGAGLPGCATTGAGATAGKDKLPDFYADIEERTFRWFWNNVNRANGLVPDRTPNPPFCSIAAVGFALTAYAVGVERGWAKREEARDLTLTTLKFFASLPQGDGRSGVSGQRGFFYHFLDMKTGLRYRDTELSSVDTTLMHFGMLFAASYWEGDDPAEIEIRDVANDLVGRAEWPWFLNKRPVVSMGWDPKKGFIERSWDGYNEGMMVVLLGLGSTRYPLPDGAWNAWTAPYPRFWRGEGATRHLAFAPMFGHQYSHVWIDFRGIRDVVMRGAGFDYFENSRRATFANRAYCMANPMGWEGYSRDIWGLTACDGPGNYKLPFPNRSGGETRTFYGYSARGPLGQPDERDDGTIAPTAALGSLPFAPEICIPAAEALLRVPGLYQQYGFLDAFNPSFRYSEKKLETGTVDAANGWVASDYLGIDQGPILLQAANYRSDFVWKVMRKSPVIRRGLQRAGFTGGWLDQK